MRFLPSGKFSMQRRCIPTMRNVLKDVDKVVGDNMFKNLDWIMKEDIIDMETHMKKLAKTNHPVLNTIRGFLENKHLTYGTILNLYAEVANANTVQSEIIREKQKIIAKVTEMLRMSVLLHKDIETINQDNQHLHTGNKITILCGDYLLSKCLNNLATLKEQFYVEYMSSALRDFTLGQTIGLKDKHYTSFPSKPHNLGDVSTLDELTWHPTLYPLSLGNPLAEWMMRTTLNGGSLLAKGCLSTLRLGNQPESVQNIGMSFGKYFALALKANDDLNDIIDNRPFELVNLVVYLLLKNNPAFYDVIEESKADLRQFDFEGLKEEILRGGVVDEAKMYRKDFVNSAVEALEIFEDSNAKSVLKDLITSLEC